MIHPDGTLIKVMEVVMDWFKSKSKDKYISSADLVNYANTIKV